jgi:hypothetical protein
MKNEFGPDEAIVLLSTLFFSILKFIHSHQDVHNKHAHHSLQKHYLVPGPDSRYILLLAIIYSS